MAIFQEVGCDRETGLAKAAPPPRGRQEEGVCSFSTLSKCYVFFFFSYIYIFSPPAPDLAHLFFVAIILLHILCNHTFYKCFVPFV